MTHSVQVSEVPSLGQQTSGGVAGSGAVGLGQGKGLLCGDLSQVGLWDASEGKVNVGQRVRQSGSAPGQHREWKLQ